MSNKKSAAAKGLLIVLSAPSGCGKTSIVERLLKRNPDWVRSVSATTREPRIGEKNGEDYFFYSKPEFEKMIRDGAIKLQPLPYIRGRSLVNALLIVDESQNLTPHEVKTIITRAGRGTRIILTGDPDQIDNPYVDRLSNGLTYAADRLGREDFTAVVPLVQGERSPMSARAAELL